MNFNEKAIAFRKIILSHSRDELSSVLLNYIKDDKISYNKLAEELYSLYACSNDEKRLLIENIFELFTGQNLEQFFKDVSVY